MIYDPIPLKLTNLSPVDRSVFPESTTQVTLSWAAGSANLPYVLHVMDLTDPSARHSGRHCPDDKRYLCVDNLTRTSFVLTVRANRAYSWIVYQANGDLLSEAASATFRVGECDAAEILSEGVPEIIEQDATVTARIVVRNVGSRTWKPALGYRLGSDDSTWGLTRVEMNTNSQVATGQLHTFTWSVRAPNVPKSYRFQWRMIQGDSNWFGAKTASRYLSVKTHQHMQNYSEGTRGSLVKRDAASGRLLRLGGDFITLRGGNYHVFEKDSRAQRKLVPPQPPGEEGQDVAAIAADYYLRLPCAPRLGGSTLTPWPNPENNPWEPLFTVLFNNDINLLRVLMTNGLGISESELYPFQLEDGKWLIKKAITAPLVEDNWNEDYFARLKAFVDKAASKRIWVQLSVFNYYDVDDDVWNESIWNPDNSDDRGWGLMNLVNAPTDYLCSDGGIGAAEGRRNCYFIEPPVTSMLRLTQETFVRKVVKELAGRPNVILEVMNEPHRGSFRTSAAFASAVIGWIIDQGSQLSPKWRPLISVNASVRALDPKDPDRSDVDWWSDAQSNIPGGNFVSNYEEIDIISYHMLTGYQTFNNVTFRCDFRNDNAPIETGAFARADLRSIRARRDTFLARHPSKALMLSTDAVRMIRYNHVYGANTIDLSDGQINTRMDSKTATPFYQIVRSDIQNWAYWCFKAGNEKTTVVHFQNHSNFESTYKRIKDAYDGAFQEFLQS